MRGERDDGPGTTRELVVVPLEFYFTEQIIWLTGMVPPPPQPITSFLILICCSILPSTAGEMGVCRYGVCTRGCLPHVLLVMSRGIINDNSPQLSDH